MSDSTAPRHYSAAAAAAKNMDDRNDEDEAKRILHEVETTAADLAKTEYYGYIAALFRNDPAFRGRLDRVLGTGGKPAPMVIYALGSPEFSHRSQCQLALAILLWRHFPERIREIKLFDPKFTPADGLTFKMLELEVLPDEQFRRVADEPTLFFLPFANYWQQEHLLEANWSADNLSRMIILSNGLYGHQAERCRCSDPKEYSDVLREYARPIEVSTRFHHSYSRIFGDLSFIFFDIGPSVDMGSLLPDGFKQRRGEAQQYHAPDYNYIRDLLEEFFREQFKPGYEFDPLGGYRFPRQHRCEWRPPPAGWLKLNFSGTACDGVSPAGYGGILRDEYENVIATYSCSLGELADATVVNVEALREGMRLLKNVPGGVKKLVVEGTDVSVVRWASSWPEPPGKVKEAVDDILKVAARIKTVIYHVYEEANKAAITLAKAGATSQDRHVWIRGSNKSK